MSREDLKKEAKIKQLKDLRKRMQKKMMEEFDPKEEAAKEQSASEEKAKKKPKEEDDEFTAEKKAFMRGEGEGPSKLKTKLMISIPNMKPPKMAASGSKKK